MLNNFNSIFVMMISESCSSRFCAFHQIMVQRKEYLSGAKTKMTNVRYPMGSQSLAHLTL